MRFTSPSRPTVRWLGRGGLRCVGQRLLEAIDYQTGKPRWTHELGPGGSNAGVLTTESGVTFTGDAMGNFLALRTSDGKTLWHAGTGAHIDTSPISFEVDGRQYIVEGSGTAIFAWALPSQMAGHGRPGKTAASTKSAHAAVNP